MFTAGGDNGDVFKFCSDEDVQREVRGGEYVMLESRHLWRNYTIIYLQNPGTLRS